MVFSSPYFLWLFLPFALAVCLALRRVAYLPAIMVVSLLFYFWSAGADTLILVALIVGNYAAANRLARGASPMVFAALIAANGAILAWYKYAAFVARSLDAALGTHLQDLPYPSVLPAGISFFVFQAISYLTDVRRRDIEPERSITTYGAYQAFFPHLIAGPIVRYRDVIGDLRNPRWSLEGSALGISRFAHGLAKKALIADGVAPVADAVFELKAHEFEFASACLGAVAYTLQIYFDFSGYSDMAIGLALLFGIRFHENFKRPYASSSVTDFWRRWHISLSSWFRDYVYIPLGGSRGGSWQTYRNLLIVFAVTGLWHGAAWTFVVWGLYHGLFLIMERAIFADPARSLRHRALRYCYCMPVVVFGWVLFRAPTLRRTLGMWKAMLSPFGASSELPSSVFNTLTPYSMAALAGGLLIALLSGRTSFGEWLAAQDTTGTARFAALGYTVVALTVSGVVMITGSYSPFLYFNF